MKLIENEDYQLVPLNDNDWGIRFLKGEFVETVVFGIVLSYNEHTQNLNFAFEIENTPDGDLTPDNTELQRCVGDVLGSILEDDDGAIVNER